MDGGPPGAAVEKHHQKAEPLSPQGWTSRRLTQGEIDLFRCVFGDSIEFRRVRILRRKAVFFQPPGITMAPDGNIYFHPRGPIATGPHIDDFSEAPLALRAHLIHEMTHVLQHQRGINLILEKTLMFFRHGPLGGYSYQLLPEKNFFTYNIEQQACIIADHYIALSSPVPPPNLTALHATLAALR